MFGEQDFLANTPMVNELTWNSQLKSLQTKGSFRQPSGCFWTKFIEVKGSFYFILFFRHLFLRQFNEHMNVLTFAYFSFVFIFSFFLITANIDW